MDKVLIDVEVVKGIIKAYNRTKNQTRIFGIILGTKKDNLYHISEVIYGFIFEEGENKETHKKTYVRLNEDNLNSILNSYTHKFKLFPPQKVNEKASKEKSEKNVEKNSEGSINPEISGINKEPGQNNNFDITDTNYFPLIKKQTVIVPQTE